MIEKCSNIKNKSLSTLEPEIELYKILVDIFGKKDVKKQYTDTRYPYSCDFYIKSIDLFIEFQYHWSHGGHRFDSGCIEDLKKSISWKNSELDSYKKSYIVWTIEDIEKRKCALDNNLNYLEIWKFFDKEDVSNQINKVLKV